MGSVLLGLYIFYPYLRFMINYLSMPDTEVSRVEVARISSPDAKLDAVVIRTNVNATTPYGHDIYLVPTGSKPKYDRANFRADHFEGWKVTWEQPKLLEIEYDEARIFHFSNFWQSIDFDEARYVVEIRLAPRSPINSLSKRDRGLEP